MGGPAPGDIGVAVEITGPVHRRPSAVAHQFPPIGGTKGPPGYRKNDGDVRYYARVRPCVASAENSQGLVAQGGLLGLGTRPCDFTRDMAGIWGAGRTRRPHESIVLMPRGSAAKWPPCKRTQMASGFRASRRPVSSGGTQCTRSRTMWVPHDGQCDGVRVTRRWTSLDAFCEERCRTRGSGPASTIGFRPWRNRHGTSNRRLRGEHRHEAGVAAGAGVTAAVNGGARTARRQRAGAAASAGGGAATTSGGGLRTGAGAGRGGGAAILLRMFCSDA